MAGPAYALSQGETYVLSKQNNTVYIKSSTDSVEGTFLIRNNLQIRISGNTGSYSADSITLRGIGGNALINFQNSATTSKNYILGYSDTHDRFSLNRGNNFTNSATLKIFHINSGSSTFHVDNGLIVTGSASVSDNLAVTGSLDIANTVRYRGEIYSEFTFTANGAYTSGTWYDVVHSNQLAEGIYIIQGYVDTYDAGSDIWRIKFASVPFYWFASTGTNDTDTISLPAVIGSGHAKNGVTLPTFQLKLTEQPPTDGKLYLQFNPQANWSGIDGTAGNTFNVYLKRIG